MISALAWPLHLAGLLARAVIGPTGRPGCRSVSAEQVLSRPRSILIVRRNRIGDVLSVLPLLKNLRSRFPDACLVLACDPIGSSVVQAMPDLDRWIVLNQKRSWWRRWIALWFDAAKLQGFDVVLGVKGGYDFRLACLVRWSNGRVRIGFAPGRLHKHSGLASLFYTHPVDLPEPAGREHQVDTQLRLLAPFCFQPRPFLPEQVDWKLPFSLRSLAQNRTRPVPELLINLSCNRPVLFSLSDWKALLVQVLRKSSWRIGLISLPGEAVFREKLAQEVRSPRVELLETSTPLHLAALLQEAKAFVTPEGGAIHLAALTRTPTVVLWSEGNFTKWNSRSSRHLYVRPTSPGKPSDLSKTSSTGRRSLLAAWSDWFDQKRHDRPLQANRQIDLESVWRGLEQLGAVPAGNEKIGRLDGAL